MKRFLSLILAIAMLLSLTSMVVFAEETPDFGVETEGEADLNVGFDQLTQPVLGTEKNPIVIGTAGTFDVNVKAGESVYYAINSQLAGYFFGTTAVIEDVTITLDGMELYANQFSATESAYCELIQPAGAVSCLIITNNGTADVEFQAEIATQGTAYNPLRVMTIGDFAINAEAGQTVNYIISGGLQGLVLTIPAAGLTATFNGVELTAAKGLYTADVMPISAAGATLAVTAGASDVNVNGNVNYALGSEKNPIVFGERGDYSVSAAADEGVTYYLIPSRLNGLVLTIACNENLEFTFNGEVLESHDEGKTVFATLNAEDTANNVLIVTNYGEEFVEVPAAIDYPAGTVENPIEVATVGQADSCSIPVGGQAYYMIMPTLAGLYVYIPNGEFDKTATLNGVEMVQEGDYLVGQLQGLPNRLVITNVNEMWDACAMPMIAELMGSESNPYNIYYEEYETTISGATYYYVSFNDAMNLTVYGEGAKLTVGEQTLESVGGEISTTLAAGEHVLCLDGEGTYTFVFSYVPGHAENPAQLVMGDNIAQIEAGSWGYFYTWTAQEDGTLTITMPEGNWSYTINNMTTYIYGEKQWSDSDPVVNPASVEVKAGDVIQLIVNTYDPASWEIPAGTLTIKAEFEVPGPKYDPYIAISGKSLILEGILRINTYVNIGNVGNLTREDVVTAGGVLYWSAKDYPGEENAFVGTETSAGVLVDTKSNYNGYPEYSAESHGIAAKEYAENIYFRPYVEIEGEYYYGDIVYYGVTDYVANQMPKTTAKAVKAKPMLAALLRYGAAAQVNFKYNTENLADARLQEYVDAGYITADMIEMNWKDSFIDPLVEVSPELAVNFQSTGTLAVTGKSLILEGEILYNYYLSVGENKSIFSDGNLDVYFWTAQDYALLAKAGTALSVENASYTVDIDPKTAIFSYTKGYGYETNAKSNGIATKSYGDSLYICFCGTDNEGNEYCSGIVPYSAETYAASRLTKNDENMKTLVKWMTIYGDRAKAYFA